MHRFKSILCGSLAAVLAAGMLTACSGNQTASSGTVSSSASSTTSSAASESFDYSKGLTEQGYFENLKATDLATLPTYKNVTVPESVYTATDEAVQEQVTSILADNTQYEQITDRAVADADTLNIDYVGKVDGVAFEGGSTDGAGTVVTIGVTQYVDDFLEQLIGHMPGETFDITVTFPDDYSETTLQGKDAVFTVTINYIQGQALDAELTDAIAQQYGFDNVDGLLEDIRQWLIEQQKATFIDELLSQATCENIPDDVLNYIIDADVAYYESYAAASNVDIDTFFSNYGYESKQAYIDSGMEEYKATAVKYLAIQAIAETEGISVSDSDLDDAEISSYIETYGRPYVVMYYLHNNGISNFVFDNAAK